MATIYINGLLLLVTTVLERGLTAPSTVLHSCDTCKFAMATKAVHRHMAIVGVPGLAVGVSLRGRPVFVEGFGFADVESGAACTPQSVMRIASISKVFTATVAARLVERGKLDLDKSIHEYLTADQFPKKCFNGKDVQITTRQLLSHTSGIRSYHKESEADSDSTAPEFFSNIHYECVIDALAPFKNDPLLCEPGTEFHYSTLAYTLLSAVLEKVDGRPFPEQLQELLEKLELRNTHLDTEKARVVSNRASYYIRNAKHMLEKAPEVDCTNKIAGGGILSNVTDLLKYADAMLYSYQFVPSAGARPPLLQPSTMRDLLWRKHAKGVVKGKWEFDYGLGWTRPKPNGWDEDEGEDDKTFKPAKYWYHGGGAVGVSSALLIKPSSFYSNDYIDTPRGISVAIMANCQDCPNMDLAKELVDIFANSSD